MQMALKKVGKAARDFRNKLACKCYDEDGNPISQPPEEYAGLRVVRESWEAFVENMGSERHRVCMFLNGL